MDFGISVVVQGGYGQVTLPVDRDLIVRKSCILMVREKGASGRRELFDCPEKNVAKDFLWTWMPFIKNTLHLRWASWADAI